MVKKIIMMAFACILFNNVYAQSKWSFSLPASKENEKISPIVKEKVDDYAKKIDEIIQEEKKMMEEELIALQNKNLDKADFDLQKKEIANRYSEKIDKRIADLGFDLDSVIEKQVKYSLLNSDVTSNEEIRAKILEKYRPKKNFSSYFSYGIMNLTNDLPDNELDKNIGYASNLEFGLNFNYHFSRTSHFGLLSGIRFSWRTLRLDNNLYFNKDSEGNVYLDKYEKSLDKNKLRTGYIIVPLGLQYNFSRLKDAGMDIKYRNFRDGFKIAGYFYGGVKMSTNNIISGDGPDFRDRGNYQVNPFVFGAQFTVSYDDFSIFVKKDFTNYFKGGNFSNDKALVFGISLGL